MHSSFDPAMPLLSIYPGGMKTYVHKNLCPNVDSDFYLSSLMEANQMSKLDKQAKCLSCEECIKLWRIHIVGSFLRTKPEGSVIHARA